MFRRFRNRHNLIPDRLIHFLIHRNINLWNRWFRKYLHLDDNIGDFDVDVPRFLLSISLPLPQLISKSVNQPVGITLTLSVNVSQSVTLSVYINQSVGITVTKSIDIRISLSKSVDF